MENQTKSASSWSFYFGEETGSKIVNNGVSLGGEGYKEQ